MLDGQKNKELSYKALSDKLAAEDLKLDELNSLLRCKGI